MSDKTFSPTAAASEHAHVASLEQYRELYEQSITDPETFWAGQAERLEWSRKWDTVREYDFGKPEIKWFEGGQCVDRGARAMAA